jgi:hypothetical protein
VREVVDWFLLCFNDWIDGNSIGHDPLVYIKGWSYPSMKYFQDLISKFPTSLEELGLSLDSPRFGLRKSEGVRSSDVRAEPELLYAKLRGFGTGSEVLISTQSQRTIYSFI